jgi:hypothetical protein
MMFGAKINGHFHGQTLISSFSNFLLDCTKEFFAGLGFFLPFLAAWILAFSDLPFLYLHQSFMSCKVYMTHASCRGCNASQSKLSSGLWP